MSSRRREVVILCEDKQQATFARRFLEKWGWEGTIRIRPFPAGSGEAHVRRNYPTELKNLRSNAARREARLIVIMDADNGTADEHRRELDRECDGNNVQRRQQHEKAAIFVPRRNVETWTAYLLGEQVDEQQEYRKLKRQRDCAPQVRQLAEKCKDQAKITDPAAPDSLRMACDEFRTRVLPART